MWHAFYKELDSPTAIDIALPKKFWKEIKKKKNICLLSLKEKCIISYSFPTRGRR